MGFILQSQRDFSLTINLRKTFARVTYFIEQTDKGKSKETILKELDLSEDEFQFLLKTMLEISMLNDNDAVISSIDILDNVNIGGVYVTRNNKTLLSL
jgi:hypothetical protein